MTAEASTGLSEGRVGRYVLEDLVAESKSGSQFWRASDPALKRPVGARLVPIEDPRVPQLRIAAKAAARVHDRRVVQVLDVVETPAFLALISEWINGQMFSEVLETERTRETLIVAYEVARTLQSAHACGVTHGRIRPASVIITESNEVRLRGLQVDAALYGVAPGSDPYQADVHGVGALLYLGLTGRWPDPLHRSGSVDGVPIVGPVAGKVPLASELVAGVPPELSRLAAACMISTPGQQPRLPDMEHAAAAIGRALERRSGDEPDLDDLLAKRSPDRMFRRLALAVIAAIAVAGTALLVGSLGLGEQAGDTPPAAATAPPAATPGAGPQPLPIAAIDDFDPQGNGEENGDLAPLAIDGDAATAWRTVPYKSSGMDPKEGTGLLLDLGLIRPVREVRLDLLGSGTDVEIRVSDTRGDAASDYELVAGAVAAGEQIALRTPIPVDARYVLIWLTNVPYANPAYQGGIREVQVLG